MITQKMTLREALKLSRLDHLQSNTKKYEDPALQRKPETDDDVSDVSDDAQQSDDQQTAHQDAPPPETQQLGQNSNDPDKQGMLRTVKGAHLIYKRQTEEGSFEELWAYNTDQLVNGLKMRKAILAGTDIPTSNLTSEDGKQTYELWSRGNIEMLLVKGLVQ